MSNTGRETAEINNIILGIVGPKKQNSDQVSDQDKRISDHDSDQDANQDVCSRVLTFCSTAKSKKEICEHLGYSNLTFFTRKYLFPLVTDGRLCESGKCTGTAQGLYWPVKRFDDNEIVLAGCSGDEYTYRSDSQKSEFFVFHSS